MKKLTNIFAAAALAAFSTAASAQAQNATENTLADTAGFCGTAIKEGGTAIDGALCLSGVRTVMQGVAQGIGSAMPERRFLEFRDGERSCKRAEGLSRLVGQWVFGRGGFELTEDMKTRPLDGFARADMTNWLHALSGCFTDVAEKINPNDMPDEARQAVVTLQQAGSTLGALRQR